MPARFH